MPIPFRQNLRIGSHLLRQRLKGNRFYPFLVEIEPLFACNLSCPGCGKIQHPTDILRKRLSVDDVVGAVEESGTPMVSIAGGEPLLHPDIDTIVSELTKRKVYVYLCTNAVLLRRRLDRFTPSRYFSWVVHVDGLGERHDAAVDRAGVFDEVVEAVKEAKAKGFRVTTNSTFFNTDSPKTVRDVLDFLNDDLKVDAMMISPAYAYEKAPDQEHFLGVTQTRALFAEAFAGSAKEMAPQPLASLPRLLGGQGGVRLHRVGNPQLLGPGLAAAVLPDGRRVRPELPRTGRDHRLGGLRARQRPALRQLHGPLRLRTDRRHCHHGEPAPVPASPREHPLMVVN